MTIQLVLVITGIVAIELSIFLLTAKWWLRRNMTITHNHELEDHKQFNSEK